MDFLELVNNYYGRLTDQEKEIISYLQQDSLDMKALTSQKLAKECFVSRASIFRLLKKLDISSFAELKYLLQQSNMPKKAEHETDFLSVTSSFHTYIDQIFKQKAFADIVQLLGQASVIYLYGTGNEQKLEVEYFRQLFTSIGKKIVVIFDFGEYNYVKKQFKQDDLLILVSYKGESSEGIDILKDSSFRGIKRLVFTRTSQNTMAQLSDYQLYVPTESIQTPTSLTYEISSTFYFIIDQLYVDVLMLVRGYASDPI
ncbi:MurR/RpiR family transcriptional regulator [Streptococcus sp. zg-JUN1979]|uniref:MurR/RpiR family transcriptional regulator n=1 Tax=Streptococcus sp. zg-JUN1979 TaxID=3391450 RepID=UPI0039A7325C